MVNDKALAVPEHEQEHQYERDKQNILEADLWAADCSSRRSVHSPESPFWFKNGTDSGVFGCYLGENRRPYGNANATM
jgi:hypothetical protein